MKNLTMIVHEDTKQALADVLRSLRHISGFTFTHIEGRGVHDSEDPTLSARDRVVGYSPQVRVDIIIEDSSVEEILQAVRADGCVLAGRGIYWVTPVEKCGNLGP